MMMGANANRMKHHMEESGVGEKVFLSNKSEQRTHEQQQQLLLLLCVCVRYVYSLLFRDSFQQNTSSLKTDSCLISIFLYLSIYPCVSISSSVSTYTFALLSSR
jgi:hypothetical protein